MTTTKKGADLIHSVPIDRIVLETDAPFTKESKKRYGYKILEDTITQIAKIKKSNRYFTQYYRWNQQRRK